MSGHTPTPWALDDDGDIIYLWVDSVKEYVGTISSHGWGAPYRENAAFIVKAVNNHEALVKALKRCRDRLKMDLDEIDHLRGWLSKSERSERAEQDEAADEADLEAIAEADRLLADVGGSRE